MTTLIFHSRGTTLEATKYQTAAHESEEIAAHPSDFRESTLRHLLPDRARSFGFPELLSKSRFGHPCIEARGYGSDRGSIENFNSLAESRACSVSKSSTRLKQLRDLLTAMISVIMCGTSELTTPLQDRFTRVCLELSRKYPDLDGVCKECGCTHLNACVLAENGDERTFCSWENNRQTLCTNPSCLAAAAKKARAA